MSFFDELKRRNVFRVAIAYIVVAWLVLQVADVILNNTDAPSWVFQVLMLFLSAGFPVALIFAWAFELTPEGLKKEKDIERRESITTVTGRKLDFIIITMLVMALGYLGYVKFVIDPQQDAIELETAVQVAHDDKTGLDQPRISAKSIAVLPFLNMSEDPNNEYFADGISEEILNLLAKMRELQVISRSSSFSFKGQNVDVPTIAARLNVEYVLEGSVRKFDNQVRITAQLIEVDTDTHLWSETYDRNFENIFAIQDEIAAAVADALKITLLGEKVLPTETDPEAYALYLLARQFRHQRTKEADRQAEKLLKQALDIDPAFATAWAELGALYMRFISDSPMLEARELGRRAVQQALTIEPKNSKAIALQSEFARIFDMDFSAASHELQNMQQALESNPNDVTILSDLAKLQILLGHPNEAIDLQRQRLILDPLSRNINYTLGILYLKAHRLEEAAESLQIARSLMPGRLGLHFYTGLVLLAQGDAPAALVAIAQETGDFLRLTGTAIVQHALGDAGASDAAIQRLIECCEVDAAFQLAEIYAFRGEIDRAFDSLEQAYDNRDGGLKNVLLHPMLANLHGDSRWEPFLDKMGLLH